MLEQKKLPILEALAAFGIGGIFTAACMAGLAYLMANQSLAQSTAWPMVSAIVCAGSFCSGWLMAFFYHSRGLICGAVQGGLFVLLLLGFGLSEGIEPTEMQLTRFALVFVFGCLGGVFSILRTERYRH
jgi:putative membrane protein (TIGR04086 family)